MKIQVCEDVKCALNIIIESENFKTKPEIKVLQGSEDGDGYGSKTYAVKIEENNGKTLNLFVKYLPEKVSDEWKDPLMEAFRGEFKFYTEIYPALNRFQEEKNIQQPFNNVPNHYMRNLQNLKLQPIILENLRSLGYTLRNRKKPVDDNHLRIPIVAFARYHALSYAMKDQMSEEFNKLCSGIEDFFAKHFKTAGMDEMLSKCINQFLENLDPVADKKILDHCGNLVENLLQHILNIPQNMDDYAVIGQGDCWSNNMMFLYDDKTGLPVDVKLIDWQCQRINSPLLDFAYFFYTLATKEALDNAGFYLNLYYATLSKRIKELGSDPDKMFPYEVFMEHWRKFSLFGLSMAFCVIKVQLFEKDEIPNLMESADDRFGAFSKVLKHQDIYQNRMKDLVEYFVDKELL